MRQSVVQSTAERLTERVDECAQVPAESPVLLGQQTMTQQPARRM